MSLKESRIRNISTLQVNKKMAAPKLYNKQVKVKSIVTEQRMTRENRETSTVTR